MSDNSPKPRKPMQRRLTIARDDPFLKVFIDKVKKEAKDTKLGGGASR